MLVPHASPMRNFRTSLALCLLLLLAQQGAVLHQISHLVHSGSLDVRVHADTVLDKSCELCLAFSQVTNPASNSVQLPRFEPVACAADPIRDSVPTLSAVLAPRSRGPPTLTLQS